MAVKKKVPSDFFSPSSNLHLPLFIWCTSHFTSLPSLCLVLPHGCHQCSDLYSSHVHCHSLTTHISVLILNSLCNSNILGCMIFHWSEADLPKIAITTTLLEKTVFPFPNQQLTGTNSSMTWGIAL